MSKINSPCKKFVKLIKKMVYALVVIGMQKRYLIGFIFQRTKNENFIRVKEKKREKRFNI